MRSSGTNEEVVMVQVDRSKKLINSAPNLFMLQQLFRP